MRTENDIFGKIKLTNEEYYGISTKRALENFPLSGYKLHPEFIKAMAEVKLACISANRKTGFLPREKAEALSQACNKIIEGEFFDQFPLDPFQGGAGTSTNMNFNEVIANLALEISGNEKGNYEKIHPLHDVNMHQSTNDVYPSALRIAILRMLKKLEVKISKLQESLQKKEQEFSNIVKIARTQLQDAVPMTLGMEFGAYAEAISRDRWRIFKCRERIKVINLGGTAIGTGLCAPRKYIFQVTEEIQNITGLNIVRSENLVETTQNLDPFVEIMGMVKTFATNLFKIASDLRLLSSGPQSGIAEIILPAVQIGSSIMPGKINPVIPEAVSQVALRVMANEQIVAIAASLGQLELNQFFPLLNHAIMESLELLHNATDIFTQKCVSGIIANKERCEQNLKESYMLATILVPYLGYKKVESLVKEAKLKKISVYDLIILKNIIPKEKLKKILAPEKMYKLGFTEEDNL